MRRLTRGRSSENDAGVTTTSSASGATDQPDQESDNVEEAARGGGVGKTADVDDDEETESEANREEDEEETDLDDVEEWGGGEGDTDVEEGHEERRREEEEGKEAGQGGKKLEGEKEKEEAEEGAEKVEEEEEEDEEDIDIDAMVKLAAAAVRMHNASSQARASGGSTTAAAAASSGTGAASSGASAESRVPSGDRVTKAQAARRRPRVSGVAPRTLESGLASPKYLQYSGTAKGKNLTVSKQYAFLRLFVVRQGRNVMPSPPCSPSPFGWCGTHKPSIHPLVLCPTYFGGPPPPLWHIIYLRVLRCSSNVAPPSLSCFSQASVSSGVVDGGKAAKLMAGSSLYSGRDRAMVRVAR